MQPSYNSHNVSTTKTLYRGTQVVWYLLGLLEILLAFRFVLKLLEANRSAWFTDVIYRITDVLTAPFSSVFRVSNVENNLFEWTTLLAMVVYRVLAILIVRLLTMSKAVSETEATVKLNNQE